MKISSVKKLAAASHQPATLATKPTVTAAEHERAVFLCSMRDYCNAKLQATPEGQAVIAASNAMNAFSKEIADKYGVEPPFNISGEGEIVRVVGG